MIATQHLEVLRKIVTRLKGSPVNWVVTGSLGMALQGVPVEVHDIDIQTDKDGAYKIERLFAEYVVKPVRYSESASIRSHFSALEIDGIKVEIMGDVQKRLDEKGWEAPVKVESYRLWVELGEMCVPVLSLAYEYQAYLKLGRTEKAKMLQTWLQRKKGQLMTPAQSIALWADKLRDISATGLRFSKDTYDRENYQIIQNIAMEMFAFSTGNTFEQIAPLRDPIFNRRTPLVVGDAAVINDASQILLIQRAGSERWALPGGALAVGETPAAGVVREVREETGLNCVPTDLVGIYDSQLGPGAAPQHQYNFLFLCQPENEKPERALHSSEILNMGWFTEDNLPTPLEPSNVKRIKDAFLMWRGNNRTYFDLW